MGNKSIRKCFVVHFVIWFFFLIGIALTVISSVVFSNENNILWRVMTFYNVNVIILSPIAVIVSFFMVCIKKNTNKLSSKTLIINILFFVTSALLWIVYIYIFVLMTGGV